MKTGIWIDKHNAHIIFPNKKNEIDIKTINSEVEDFNICGGSGTKFKGGPQDVVHDSKYLMREKQQLKNYFNKITSHLEKSKVIVIFGPAEAGKKLQKILLEKQQNLGYQIKGPIKADSMTLNQMKQWVINYFEK